jgi:CDP-glycerol glycerophosphotransferase (TagB/SpsB family)
MLRTFDILVSLDDVQVVVKPHTRNGKEAEMYKSLSLANVSDISSVELAEWADVMLVVGSSIIIEALARHKPALYLKYLHENTTEYEEFGACWIINDEDELRDALLSLRDKKGHVPYTDENVDRWLAEVIYGGQNERDVLRVYEEFIVNCATS